MDEKEIMPVPFEQALLIEETDIQTALISYKYLAEQKEIEAIQKLFLLYYEGNLLPRDFEESLHWLKVGASLDDEVCLFHLGYFYQNGIAVPINERRALNYFTRCAALPEGTGYADLFLATYYCEEAHDFEQFVFYLRKAIKKGNQDAYVYKSIVEERLTAQLKEKEKLLQIAIDEEIQARIEEEKAAYKARLADSWKTVNEIFRRKVLRNKVHFYRGPEIYFWHRKHR